MLAADAQLLPQELDISSVYSISLRDGPGRVHKVVFINDLFCPPCDVRGRSTHARCSLYRYCICDTCCPPAPVALSSFCGDTVERLWLPCRKEPANCIIMAVLRSGHGLAVFVVE